MITWKVAETEKEREQVYSLRAAEYARYYANIPSEAFHDELDEAVLPDGRPRSVLILAEQDGWAAGTVRLSVGRNPGWPEITCDSAMLMDFDLDAVVQQVGCDPGRAVIGEVGRYAIGRDGDVTAVKRAVVSSIGDQAALLGINVILAIMSPAVARGVREQGVPFTRWRPARLRRTKLAEVRTLLCYHDYFLPTIRKQGLEIDPSRLDSAANLAALQALIDDCPDGACLWYVRTDDWVKNVKRNPKELERWCTVSAAANGIQ